MQAGAGELAAGVPDRVLQVGDGLGILLREQVEGGCRAVALLHATARETVAPHLGEDILGIVGPTERHIAAGQRGLGDAGNLGLCAV